MNFKRNLSIIRNVKNTKFFLFLGICLIFIGFSVFSPQKVETIKQSATPTPTSSPISTYSKVTKVFDGDTIEIEGGQKVRYIGIDAAEVYPTIQCFSEEALAKNKELVLGKVVRIEKDLSETDKYGRLLRFVYIGDVFVNDELTKDGFTKVMTVPPDVKNKDQFLQSEKYAEENNLGLWGKCQN